MATSYAAQLAKLEAEYARLYDEIEQKGGIDYKGHLAALNNEIKKLRQNAEKWQKMYQAVESADPAVSARAVVEAMLEEDEDTAEIAADFIENEVGRLDWVRNWEVVRSKEDPVLKVQKYLQTYGLVANAEEIVAFIDKMAIDNPGRWK